MHHSRDISEKQSEHELIIRKKDDEIRQAKQDASSSVAELARVREDEVRRVGILHSAFVSYFNSSNSTPK